MVDEEKRAQLNAFKCSGPAVDNEAEHFFVCAQCGQAVDMRKLGDVFAHEDPHSEPIDPIN